MAMIRILAIDAPDGKMDGVTWWRNYRPLTEMAKAYPDLIIEHFSENVPAHKLMTANVVILFRPIKPQTLAFIEKCKASIFNIKIILDIDDNLWRLPPGHPSELDYIEHASTLSKIYSLADGVWCSTDPLMDFADARDGRGVVVANAVLPKDLPDKPSKYTGFVCWRGSIVQREDIEAPESVELFNRHKDSFARWLFWGWYPGRLRAKNTIGGRYVALEQYMNGIKHQGINIMWKPLQNNAFNDSKSNIAWIEATMAGAICVTNYAIKPGWEWAIDDFTTNEDLIASQWAASKKAILKHYDLRKVNEIRYQHILKTLKI